MAEFKCEVVRAVIVPHPNADAIEICMVGDYQSIVKKGQLRTGDLAVYLPEQAIIPEWLLKEMGFWDTTRDIGMLHGAGRNRVKAIKLRGVVSQGIILTGCQCSLGIADVATVMLKRPTPEGEAAWENGCVLANGDDAAEFLGIVKFEPKLPSYMMGRCVGVDLAATHSYDFDNLKKCPTLFDDGEEVVITEKIHGTFIQIGVVPTADANEEYYGGRVIISSKGMGAKGWVLDHNDEGNLYVQAAKKHGLLDKVLEYGGHLANIRKKPVFLFGEVFGLTSSDAGIQDLRYTGERVDFRAFDICVGNRGGESYFDFESFVTACQVMGVESVPVLYAGPYSKEVVLEHTDGSTTLSDAKSPDVFRPHIREGVVVKSRYETRNPHYGRKIAKSVSDAYLLRKSENATEFA